jgi:hypothetical protein
MVRFGAGAGVYVRSFLFDGERFLVLLASQLGILWCASFLFSMFRAKVRSCCAALDRVEISLFAWEVCDDVKEALLWEMETALSHVGTL